VIHAYRSDYNYVKTPPLSHSFILESPKNDVEEYGKRIGKQMCNIVEY
jgi:hypothetical protein